jgi:hypothetical protein
MEVWWDENEEAADEVEEGPGDRHANDHEDGRLEPSRGPVNGFDRGDFSQETGRAKKFSFMLGDALPAEIVSAPRTTGDRLAIRVNQAPLKSELHREISVRRGTKKNEPQIAQITWITGGRERTVWFKVGLKVVGFLTGRFGSVVRLRPFPCESREFFPGGRSGAFEPRFASERCKWGLGRSCGQKQIRTIR